MITKQGKTFIKDREGCLLVPTWDAIGKVWNVGWGHRFKPGEPRVPITQAEADALFDIDILYYTDQVDRMVKVPLDDNQKDALYSFAYNLGWQALESSTLLKMVNAAWYDAAANQILRWNKAQGVKIRGLCNRRYDEAMVYAFADYSLPK